MDGHSKAAGDHLLSRIDSLCDQFEDDWKGGRHPRIEDYVDQVPPNDRPSLLRELLHIELTYRKDEGNTAIETEYRDRFPEHGEVIQNLFGELKLRPTSEAESSIDGDKSLTSSARIELSDTLLYPQDSTGESTSDWHLPTQIGPYRIAKLLGQGGFGIVYLGLDEELQRHVAIKMPRPEFVSSESDIREFLREARLAAGLDHPNIVPVYHVGRTKDGRPFIVSKYIAGTTYSELLEASPPLDESLKILGAVADALHFAHRQGLVHRDVKPANILLSESGTPFVADFGLAMHEADQQKHAGEISGTIPYMSPEQARGDSHRLDGRSDIWSLGVLLYETLTNRRPFAGRRRSELFDEILHREPRPPRMIDDSIPAELERICLKCLTKRIDERYTTAADVGRDLREAVGGAPHSRAPIEQPASAVAKQNVLRLPFRLDDIMQRPNILEGAELGPYLLRKLLGAGGSGVVFKAENRSLGQVVCVKVSYPLQLDRGAIMAAVRRGVRGLIALDHPRIARIHDISEVSFVDGDSFYLAMEYLSRVDLGTWTRKLGTTSECWIRRMQVGKLVASAIEAAHECSYFDEAGFEIRGVLHGDLKPTNILMRGDEPVLNDFMLVDVQRLLERERPTARPEHLSTDIADTCVFGTPGFMAPEQAEEGRVTVASDIYGLGMTFLDLFFPDQDITRFTNPAELDPPHDEVVRLLQAMTEPDPSDRPARMAVVVEAMQEITNRYLPDNSRSPDNPAGAVPKVHDAKPGSPTAILNDVNGRVLPGSLIQGRYQLDEVTSEGGFGTYYRATDVRFDSAVTVWVGCVPLAMQDPVDEHKAKEQFLGVLRKLVAFRHPNAIEHLGYEILDDGRPVLVFEHILGNTLRSMIDRGDRLDRDGVCQLAEDVASALQAAHDGGLFHMNLHPGKVLHGHSGRYTVLHLGMSALANIDQKYTPPSMRMVDPTGTPAYLPPETYVGLAEGCVNEITAPEQAYGTMQSHQESVDIYQFGLILYEALTGRHPFQKQAGTFFELCDAIISSAPLRPTESTPGIRLPLDAEQVIIDCLAKKPEDRPRSIAEAADRFIQAWSAGDDFGDSAPLLEEDIQNARSSEMQSRNRPLVPSDATAAEHESGYTVDTPSLYVTMQSTSPLKFQIEEACDAESDEQLKKIWDSVTDYILDTMTRHHTGEVVLSLLGVGYMSSYAVSKLIQIKTNAVRINRRIQFIDVRPVLMEQFRSLRVDKFFGDVVEIVPTRAEREESFNQAQTLDGPEAHNKRPWWQFWTS